MYSISWAINPMRTQGGEYHNRMWLRQSAHIINRILAWCHMNDKGAQISYNPLSQGGYDKIRSLVFISCIYAQYILCKTHALRSLKGANTPSTRLNVHIAQWKCGQCLCGSQSLFHAPADEINVSDHPIDLVHGEARLRGLISPSLLTI